MSSANSRAWLGLTFLATVLAIILFGSAGTARYWQGWLFLGVFFAASTLITLYLMKCNPALLERRVRSGPLAEKERSQKAIQSVASLGFIALFIVAGLDRRLGWSHVPMLVTIAGDVLLAIGFYIVYLVYEENSFTSATIEVSPGQRVISTGPYALVRHPMYAGALLIFIGTPLALSSYWALLPAVAMLVPLIWRLLDEETFLANNLPGYSEYCSMVRWRLIPAVF